MILDTEKTTFDKLIGESPEFKKQIEIAQKAARVDAPVLITGETGTGKELFAKTIHCRSTRGKGPYVAENCGAIPGELLESVFFGTRRGAFTHAVSKAGLFEMADGGSLLLDELNSMPTDLQPKLLRALQEGVVRRLGGSEEISFDVRIMAAMNESADAVLRTGRLRQDLFYRLNVIPIRIPPLRERREDIPLYAEYFLDKYNRKYDKALEGFRSEAMAELKQRSFPGNVRELENLIEAAVLMSYGTGMIRISDLF